jgi:TRAP transporter 4TM/12TM fusion protein
LNFWGHYNGPAFFSFVPRIIQYAPSVFLNSAKRSTPVSEGTQLNNKAPVVSEETKRAFTGPMKFFVTAVAVAFTIYEIAFLVFLVTDLWIFMTGAMIFIMVLGFLTLPSSRKTAGRITFWDIFFIFLGVSPCLFILYDYERLQWVYGSTVDPPDVVFGLFLIVAVIELARRAFGWAMPILACVFLLYAFLGHHLPAGLLGHMGIEPQKVIGFQLGEMAVLGIIMSVMVRIIFLFMLFSAFFQLSGAGEFFIQFSNSLAGRWRGGPAKVAVIASSLFGTISGNSVANVVTTGSFTIPLMKKTGYRPYFAGAVEATASTGGQIMPPIMGAAAFIIAELLGITYGAVVVAAAIPAILYYCGVFCMVDLEAAKLNLKGLDRSQLPKAMLVLKEGGHLLIPIGVLIHQLLIAQVSLSRAGLVSIVAVILTSLLRKNTRMGLGAIIEGMSRGAQSSVSIAAICACAGIIVGVVSITGLGIKFSSVVISLSHGSLLLCLVFTAIICLFLGMGLPTTAAYIVGAAVAAPALIKLDVYPLSAHLFVFYFACISAITPPVCAAAYAGAAIAGSPIFKTGFTATKLGIAAYIVPFLFVYYPVLLMRGSVESILWASVTALIAVMAVSMAAEGNFYFGRIKFNLFQRFLFVGAFAGLIVPGWHSDLFGFFVLLMGMIINLEFRTLIKRAILGFFSKNREEVVREIEKT